MASQHGDFHLVNGGREGEVVLHNYSMADRHSAATRPRAAPAQFLPKDPPPWVRIQPPQSMSFGARFYRDVVKRGVDIVLSLLLIVVFSPLFLLACLIVLKNLGWPIFFKQERVGKDGRPFTVYKFRTMLPDRRATSLLIIFPERRKTHKSSRDPRVTGAGALLRKTSIDELPQLFNVLRGDMSIVGPRPELPSIVARYALWQYERLAVLPGITGWWQVEGRGAQPMHEHADLDVYYVRNQSWWLDLKILLRTFGVVISRSGAF